MKAKLIRTAIFGVILLASLTVHAQAITRSICEGVCYTANEDKAAQECWANSPLKDSVISEQKRIIDLVQSELSVVQHSNNVLAEANTVLTQDNEELTLKLPRRFKWGLGIGGVGGVLIGIGVSQLIK